MVGRMFLYVGKQKGSKLMRRVDLIFLVGVILGCGNVSAATNTWDVHTLYGGIDGAKLQAAVNDAVTYRSTHTNDTVVLDLAAGTYYIEEEINIDNLNSGGTGWLIIQGQGIGVTELVDTEYDTDPGAVTLEGSAVHRLKIADMSIIGERLTGSQGTVVALTSSQVDIDIDDGFPVPTELFETDTTKANKIRLMDDSDPANPHYVEYAGNDHYLYRIAWQGSDTGMLPSNLYDRVWRFFTNENPPYQVGDRLAISSKSSRSNWGAFGQGGTDIVFENIALKRLGRIKFRHQDAATWDGIRFTNVSISRSLTNGITQFYSTDAGPQFGHDPDGGAVSNLVVENCDFRGTTDDGSAFQRVVSGYAISNRWEDGGGTLVGENCTAGLVFSNNVHYHCPLEDNRAGAVHYKGAFGFSPTNGTVVAGEAMLRWEAGSDAELHDIYFGTNNPPPFVGRQSATNYATGTLLPGTTYYWRVNEYHSVLGINEGDLQHLATGDVLTWDVAANWGVTQSGIATAIDAARNHFSTQAQDTVMLQLPAGTYDIGGDGSHSIDLGNGSLLQPGDAGRLIIEGAGMDATTLVFTETDENEIYGRNIHHLTFRDMHMTRAQYTVSQGTVVEVGSDYVDLELHDGYPIPTDIIRWSAPQGLYLRRYLPSLTDPIIITDDNNDQVSWTTNSYQVAGNRWRMVATAAHASRLAGYQIGEYVGIKSKHTGNTYWFTGSSDIVFENMKWTHSTRGVLRGGSSNVRFSGCRIERSPPVNGQMPCMSGPGGGPQMNQPDDALSTNMVIENCYIESTGDDCAAFFHVDGGMVSNCVFRDSFARGILLTDKATNVVFTGNTVVTRGPIQGSSVYDDSIPPAVPTGLTGSTAGVLCRLSWDANTEPDFHYYQIYRKLDGVWWTYAISTQTQYDDLWVRGGKTYEYYIDAVDTSGNHSPPTGTNSMELSVYDVWAGSFGLSGNIADEIANPDEDPLNNLYEYGLGGDPTNDASTGYVPTFGSSDVGGTNWVEYIYPRRTNDTAITYWLELTDDLVSNVWTNFGSIEIDIGPLSTDFVSVTNRIPTIGKTNQFIRLRIEI